METGSANGATEIRVKIVNGAEAEEFRGEPLSMSLPVCQAFSVRGNARQNFSRSLIFSSGDAQ